MKYTKKLVALTVALILALALAMPAMAAQEIDSGLKGTGTITITNATLGEDYAIYKVFDATYTGVDNASYTINKNSDWFNTIDSAKDYFTLDASAGDPNVYVVSFVATKSGAEVRDYLASIVENGTSIKPDASTPADSAPGVHDGGATDVEVKFTNVAFGYYLVQSSLGEGTVTVTNAKPDATVIDKNQKPTGGEDFKTVEDSSVQIGEEATFTVTYTTTNYDGQTIIEHYDAKDTMPTGKMVLNTTSLEVKVGDTTLEYDDGASEVGEYTYTGTITANGFDIDIKWYDTETKAFLYESPNTLTITYKATLTSNADIDGTGNVNSAEIGWNGFTKDTDTEPLYTYALAIKKVNKDGDSLADATFKLTDSTGTQINVSEVSIASSEDTDSPNIYVVDKKGSATITSPKSGLIVVKGVDSDPYTLTETDAPAGYNLMTESKTVTPVATSETSTTVTKWLDANGNVIDEETSIPVTIELSNVAATPVFVVNFTGTELPSTGGIGTTIFYSLGGLLVVGAAVLLVTKKRVHDMEA